MNKFRRLLFVLGVMTLLAGVSGWTSAGVNVIIGDGASVIPPNPTGSKFNLLLPASGGELLNCTHPCGVYFPTGALAFQGSTPPPTTHPANAEFLFRDGCGIAPMPACSAGTVARIEIIDSSTQRVALKGLQVTALKDAPSPTQPITLSLAFSTQPGDLSTPPNGGSASYPWTVVLAGYFTKIPLQDPGLMALTGSCNPPGGALLPPCANLLFKFNGVPMDKRGVSTTRTTSIPCSGTTTGESPCGRGFYFGSGMFSSSDWANADCVNCKPVHEVVASASFTLARQSLALANSAVFGMSTLEEEEYGVEDLFYSFAAETGGPMWVTFTAGTGEYFPWGKPMTLTSIGTDKLPVKERARNNRSYASFISAPTKLYWHQVDLLKLRYEVVTGYSHSADPELGKLRFDDCERGSFRVRVALTADGKTVAGILAVNLGSAKEFIGDCALAAEALNGTNLVQNPEPRVVAWFPGKKPKCCMTIKESQSKYNDYLVRSISVVVDQGIPPSSGRNYKVNLLEAVVNSYSSAAASGK